MTEFQLKVIKWFIESVNEHAEKNMLKTGKLEGAHKAAMDQVLKECESMPRTEPHIDEGPAEYIIANKDNHAQVMRDAGIETKTETKEDFTKSWTKFTAPFDDIISKIKAENPQPRMSVIEAVFCNILRSGIQRAMSESHNLRDPVSIAAFVTGYMASMRAFPDQK